MAWTETISFPTCNPDSLHPRTHNLYKNLQGRTLSEDREETELSPEQPACILEMFYYVMQSRTHPAILLKEQDSELQLTLFSGGKGAGSLAESPDAA